MYEKLTALLPAFREEDYGKWITNENCFPYVRYNEKVYQLVKETMDFVRGHPEFELARYAEILEESGLGRNGQNMEPDSIMGLGGREILAYLVGLFRAERICEGLLLGFCESGCMTKCLERLKALDDY